MQTELLYLLRMLLAVILGFIIGLERKQRFKEAGIRTHAIVCAGSCLIMLISKYGFSDIDGKFDGSRIASQIVSGIGFIGAGMILYKRQALHGLTTAAGIWTTAGIGMAVGSGLYYLSVGATLLIVGIQCIMHLPIKFITPKSYKQMRVVFFCNNGENENVKQLFDIKRFTKISATRQDGSVVFNTLISTDKIYSDDYISKVLKDNDYIISIERADDE